MNHDVNNSWPKAPRCLGDHAGNLSEKLLAKMLDHRRSVYDHTYGIKCLCGELELGIKGIHRIGDGPKDIGDPYSIICNSCGHQAVIFDYTKHGWDGEICDVKMWFDGTEEEREVYCPHCSGHLFELAASFEPIPDNEEYEIEIKEKGAENLFSWFLLIGVCAGCGILLQIASIECA